MAKWDLSGIHGIRRFIWSLLQTELGWKTKDYRGANPIVTPSQVQEFNDYGAPYIVYTYAHLPSSTDYYIHEEQAAFIIYAGDEEDIRKTINLLQEYFRAHDASAKLVNGWIQENGSADNKAFDYKVVRVTSTASSSPAVQEGGRYSGLVSIHYKYVREPRVDFGIEPHQPTPPEPEPPVEP